MDTTKHRCFDIKYVFIGEDEMNLEGNKENNVISMEAQIESIQKHLHKVPLNYRESNTVTDMVMMKDYHRIIMFLKRKGYSFEDIEKGNFH